MSLPMKPRQCPFQARFQPATAYRPSLFKFPVFRNWYDFRDRMEKANRNGECDEIERFATSLGRNPHCTYNSETQSHTVQVGGESVTITREDFDDRKWQKKIRKATQSKRSPYN